MEADAKEVTSEGADGSEKRRVLPPLLPFLFPSMDHFSRGGGGGGEFAFFWGRSVSQKGDPRHPCRLQQLETDSPPPFSKIQINGEKLSPSFPFPILFQKMNLVVTVL